MSDWTAAGAAVTAGAAGSAAWLIRRAWPVPLMSLVTWAAPAAVLAPLAALGWLTADGLVLWAPLSNVLAVSLVLPQLTVPTR